MNSEMMASMPANTKIYKETWSQLKGDWTSTIFCHLGYWGVTSLATGVGFIILLALSCVLDFFNIEIEPESLSTMLKICGVLAIVIAIFISIPIYFGYKNMFLGFARGNRAVITEDLFSAFSHYDVQGYQKVSFGKKYLHWLGASLLYTLFFLILTVAVPYLASLIFRNSDISLEAFLIILLAVTIIPTLYFTYHLIFTAHIVLDHEDMPFWKTLLESSKLLKGYRLKLFLLDLPFIVFYIALYFAYYYVLLHGSTSTILTTSIIVFVCTLLIFVIFMPYLQIAHAIFYDKLRALKNGNFK